MNWTSVESSQISGVGHDSSTQTLGVRFKAGKRSAASEYHYSNVSNELFTQLVNAESVGSYFGQHIKPFADLYPYRKIEANPRPPSLIVSTTKSMSGGETETTDSTVGVIVDAPGSALAKIDTITVADMFTPNFMDPILLAIREEVMAQVAKLDISTEPNRKAIASIAYKVAKSKTFVDQQRKAYVATEKKRLQTIDSEGSRIWDILEGIQREARQQLTEWEDAEKARVKGHEDAIIAIHGAKNAHYPTVDSLIAAIAALNAIDPKTFQEFEVPARGAKQAALEFLTEELTRRQEAEANAKELERLRAESAARAQQDAIEAAATAAREAAEKAQREAEERAAKAEQARKDAEANAAAEAERAVVAERARVAAEEKAAQDAAEKRAANKKHREKVNAAAAEAFVSHNMTRELADFLVDLIAEGKIPNVSINY